MSELVLAAIAFGFSFHFFKWFFRITGILAGSKLAESYFQMQHQENQ